MKIFLENVRCFDKPLKLTLKPLTLLVGENSSGKSTFLAMLAYLSQSEFPGVRHQTSIRLHLTWERTTLSQPIRGADMVAQIIFPSAIPRRVVFKGLFTLPTRITEGNRNSRAFPSREHLVNFLWRSTTIYVESWSAGLQKVDNLRSRWIYRKLVWPDFWFHFLVASKRDRNRRPLTSSI